MAVCDSLSSQRKLAIPMRAVIRLAIAGDKCNRLPPLFRSPKRPFRISHFWTTVWQRCRERWVVYMRNSLGQTRQAWETPRQFQGEWSQK
jgi:hypothetical protein